MVIKIRIVLHLAAFLLILGSCRERHFNVNQSIIYDLYIGMAQDSCIEKLRSYTMNGFFRSSKTFLPFETEFDLNGQIGEISIEPVYKEDRLSMIIFEMCYKAWAPWNRNLFASNVVNALTESNDLWPGIVFKTSNNTWRSKYRKYDILMSARDEKYMRGRITR